jgi:hypothetical protein
MTCRRCLPVLLAFAALVGCASEQYDTDFPGGFRTRLTRDGSGIATRLPPASYRSGNAELTALPTYTAGSGEPFQMDLRSYDLRKLDLSSKLADLRHADFDSKTRWPRHLPSGFDPGAIMKAARNPGLGVRALHRQGITGKGVGLAIIDGGLLVNHVEYRDRLKLYEEIHCLDQDAVMHGAAVASLAVGRTIGVAPGADLYYIAVTNRKEKLSDADRERGQRGRLDSACYAQAIDRLLEINRRLPKERRIRVISISSGWPSDVSGYQEAKAAVARARREGVFVLSVSLTEDYGLNYHALGRDPARDPDRADSYSACSWVRNYLDLTRASLLLAPTDSRTTASPTGPRDYVFYREGGLSWTTPYLAGVYALACQVKPDITPEQFWAKAFATGDVIDVVDQPSPDPKGLLAQGVARDVEASVRDIKHRAGAMSLDEEFARAYTALTGLPRERMTEAQYLAWLTKLTAARTIGDGKRHKLGTIINPSRLIESLQGRSADATG